VLGDFFCSYLTGRKTMYKWDDSVSGLFAADIGVGQGSGLSPVLSGLYIGPVMKLFSFELISKEVQLLSYVDDGTVLTQSTHLVQNLPKLKAAYGVIFRLLTALGLVLEHNKSEVFHFSRSWGESHPPIDLGFAPYTGDTPLGPKLYWRYLGFYFDHSLTFREHIRYYSTKAMTTVKALGMLGNSNRGVLASHKRLLYCTCIVPVATYGLCLWYLQGTRLKGIIKGLSAVQRLVALWITGCFCTSPTGGTEALAGLVPMHILLKRLAARSCACMATLGHSHPVCALLEPALMGSAPLVPLGLGGLSTAVKQRLISPAKDAQAACADFTETFQALHPETEPGNRLLDMFLDHITCHLSPRMSDDRYGDYVKQLDAALSAARRDVDCVHISSDASAPKGAFQASLATLVFRGGNRIAQIVAAGGRATTLNAELMALEMGISTALAGGCSSLVCFTDSTLAMTDLVDPSLHSGQASSLAACSALRAWFAQDQ